MMLSCPCGHNHSDSIAWAYVVKQVADLGETVVVTVFGLGSWRVPRVYVAMHGLRGDQLPALASKYGWERVVDAEMGSDGSSRSN